MIAEPVDQISSPSDCIQAALNLPNGSRFYRCALQINPFAYIKRNNRTTLFNSEDEYNKAMIKTCLEIGIEVIAVTDHYRVKDSENLVHEARDAGLYAFNGFEAVTKDGVHCLCLFDPDQDKDLERFIGECGIHGTNQQSPTGSKDCVELFESVKNWGAVCIAAHVVANGGLLKELSGQSRINAWTHPNMLACAVPGPISDVPYGTKRILENKDTQYKRTLPPAILNASDACSPQDLKKNSVSTFIKMSAVSIEAFRQAFLDPDSRVRLHSNDLNPEPRAEFLAMTWEGGFLDDTSVHFNKNLNVLVGGRGTGKSTIVESLRYALDLEPIGEETRRIHEGVVSHVLQSGTKISLYVRTYKPSKRYYVIERTVPNPPVVKDNSGEVLPLSPRDIMPSVEVFGQHEISELAKNTEKLTLLLERFVDRTADHSGRKSGILLGLERTRSRINDLRRRIRRLEEQLAELPSLVEMQKQFQQAGLEQRLKEKGLLIREEQLFSSLDEQIGQYQNLYSEFNEVASIDTAFISSKALEGLPNADVLSRIEEILVNVSGKWNTLGNQFGKALDEAMDAIADTKSLWNERKTKIEQVYEKILRDLHKSKIDGEAFIELRRQIEGLRPLSEKIEILKRDLEVYQTKRRNFLAEWKSIKDSEYKQLKSVAKKVSRKLKGRVKITVTKAGNRGPLEDLLREVSGKPSPSLNRLLKQEYLSLQEFAWRCQEGKEALMKHYNLTSSTAERIAQADPNLFMRVEELELPATTEIILNTAPDEEAPNWQTLEALSAGQKATAVLLLLLLQSEAPLVVDQPEDDLDNRFITEGVVPMIRREKHCRQLIFSTHNANIPVLGDAELILGLAATGVAKEGQARIAPEHMASIDVASVRELIKETLEGGEHAFEMRRSKYGFKWRKFRGGIQKRRPQRSESCQGTGCLL